jgi:hypothetical protein
MSEQQEKIALSETTRALATPIVAGLAAGSVAYGLPAAVDKVREVRVRRNRDKYITAMKDVHPDLKGIPKKDLYIAYNSMAMHSPHVLRDPLLGGQELLRMSKYRQADVNSLNEINKLRGNSMMDQAFMNATNFVASGVSEGFRGYQAQRVADQDQKYREKMDQFRQNMDVAKFELEKQRMAIQGQQFSDTYGQRERQFESGQNLSAAQHTDSMTARQQEFGYRQDEDARAEARWAVEQGTREHNLALKQVELANKATKPIRAVDQRGNEMTDGQGNPVFYHTAGVSPSDIALKAGLAGKPSPVDVSKGRPKAPNNKRERSAFTPKAVSSYTRGTPTTPLFDPNTVKAPTKTASAHDLYDIVARLRDRNL